jgi:hypothetical protein
LHAYEGKPIAISSSLLTVHGLVYAREINTIGDVLPQPQLKISHPTQLFYKTGRLRVVISTANLVDYDYRDMENVRPLLQAHQK